ncbi:putative lytic transglycosylase [Escherichia coli]|nr:putative lytic transglycosylase [Escherichia coli]
MKAYAYVENIRKYQISLVGYLQEKREAGYRSGDATGAGLSGGIAYGVGQREISFSLVSFPVVIKLFDPFSLSAVFQERE